MKHRFYLKATVLALLAALAILPTGCSGAKAEPRSMAYGGLTRTYAILVPASYTGEQPAPLVLALHGGNGTARKMEYLTQLDPIAQREGFILVYPEGVDRQWNDGRNARFGRPRNLDVDDVGFIAALIDQLTSEFNIDPHRVYATGVSNGAMMCHRLACELAGRFAALAPVIGAMPEPLHATCDPSDPVPMIMFNGTKDRLVPWDGGYVVGRPKWGSVISVPDTVQYWVNHNQCNPNPEVVPMPDTNSYDGTLVYRETYSGGQSGAEVILYHIEGGGHTWPGGARYQLRFLLGRVSRDISVSELIWEFFAEHVS